MGATPDELDELIEELTVDCYNDEQLTGFVTALEEELTSPVAATVVGTPVEVLAVDYDGDPLHGLVARCRRGEMTYTVSALDLVMADDSQPTRILAAYRRWSGNGQAVAGRTPAACESGRRA